MIQSKRPARKKQVLVFDVPDRRSIPVVGSLGREYDFHYLIPIRKGYRWQALVELVLKLTRPRYTCSVSFAAFSTEEDLADALLAHLARHPVDAVLPFSERSTALICSMKTRLEQKSKVPLGSIEDFHALNDKYLILKVCQEEGVPFPKYELVLGEQDLPKAASLGFPLVLKCCRASGVKKAMRVCRNWDDLLIAYRELVAQKAEYSFFPCDQLVAQEYIPGNIFDGGFAVWNGKVLAGISQQRVWTIPPEGGVGAYNKSIYIPEIFEYATRIFQRIRWSGPAQLEFIHDVSNNQYKLIEINPRFWGTVGLSVKAGTQIAKSLLNSAFGRDIQSLSMARDGVEFKWWLQETLVAEVLQGRSKWVIFEHLAKIASAEKDNFSYSWWANFLLALPYLFEFFTSRQRSDNKQSKSIAQRLFQ